MFFVVLALCESVKVTEETFGAVVKESAGQVLLLELWDPYCGHCAAFRPTWEELQDDTRYEGRVVFGDVDCYENKKFCEKFESHGYPAVVYVENETSHITYTGPLNMDSLEVFIQKQLSFPIRIIEREWELTKLKDSTNVASVFFFVFYSLGDKEFAVVRDVALSLKNESCLFVGMMSSTSETRLSAFKSPEIEIIYDGNWTPEQVSTFVKTNMRCLLPPLTSDIFDDFQKTGKMMLVVFLTQDQYKDVQHSVASLTTPHEMFYQLWSPDDYISRYMGASRNQLPAYMLLDAHRSQWAKSPSHDINQVQAWLNRNQFHWKGPGDGPLSVIIEPFYSAWALGGLPVYIMFACIIATVVVFIILGVGCYRMYQEEKNQKQE